MKSKESQGCSLSPHSGPQLLSTGFGFTEPGCNTVGISSPHLMKIFHQETKNRDSISPANATSQLCEHHDFSPTVTAGTACFWKQDISGQHNLHHSRLKISRMPFWLLTVTHQAQESFTSAWDHKNLTPVKYVFLVSVVFFVEGTIQKVDY